MSNGRDSIGVHFSDDLARSLEWHEQCVRRRYIKSQYARFSYTWNERQKGRAHDRTYGKRADRAAIDQRPSGGDRGEHHVNAGRNGVVGFVALAAPEAFTNLPSLHGDFAKQRATVIWVRSEGVGMGKIVRQLGLGSYVQRVVFGMEAGEKRPVRAL